MLAILIKSRMFLEGRVILSREFEDTTYVIKPCSDQASAHAYLLPGGDASCAFNAPLAWNSIVTLYTQQLVTVAVDFMS
jgi:hypothetical protein